MAEAAKQIELASVTIWQRPFLRSRGGAIVKTLIEDIDGAGNTTQAERLEKKLSAVGSVAGDNRWAATECRA